MNLRYLKWALIAALILSPSALLVLPRGGNAGFYVLVLCSLVGLACRFKAMDKSFWALMLEYWPINLGMAGLVGAIFLNHLSTGHFVTKTYDMPSRLALFPLVFWILLLLSNKQLKNIQWGLMAGALAGVVALYIDTVSGTVRPGGVLSTPMIPFGNMVFLMGALSLFSIGWNTSSEKMLIALKLVAGCAGLYAAYLSQTRGTWIAIPLLIVIGLAAQKRVRLRDQSIVLASVIALLSAVYVFSGMVQDRVASAQQDLSQYAGGENLDTSIGIRLQLWKAAWLLFREHPFFGVGLERFTGALQELAARHVITPVAATFYHAHNEILFGMATLGVFGMAAILILYFVPAFYFAREIRHPDTEVRTVASMGLALNLGFFVFGLTDVMIFYWPVSQTFYCVLLPVLFAHLVKCKAALNRQ